MPSAAELPERVEGVLAVLYLLFNEGHLASGSDTDAVRPDLTAEAVRLACLLRQLLPDDGEVAGLLALMLLTEAPGRPVLRRRRARPAARPGPHGVGPGAARGGPPAVPGAAGHRPPPGALPGTRRGQRRAHLRPRRHDTDWCRCSPSTTGSRRWTPPGGRAEPGGRAHRVAGPAAGLVVLDQLRGPLAGYRPFHVARADLLHRLARTEQARAAWDPAIGLAGNTAETAHLRRRGNGPAPRPAGS